MTFTAPTSIEAPSYTLFSITGISVNDPALSATDTLSLTIGVSQGTLKVSNSVSGGVTNVTGSGTASVVLTGTLPQINATLAATGGVQYKSTINYTGPDTLTLSATDQLDSTNTSSVALTVIGPMSVNVPASATIPANTAFAVTGVSIDYIGLPATDNSTFVLQATQGLLNLSTTVNGGLTARKSNNNSGDVTVTGTLAEINATLAAQGGLTYTPNTGYSGSETLTFQATDNATNKDTETVSLTILGPLTVTVPSGVQSVVSGGTLNVPTITVADPGLTDFADVTVVFKATNGVLNFSTSVSGGLNAAEISGNGTSTVTINAPPADLSTTLAASSGFTYKPNSGFNGTDTISVQASDPANAQVIQNISIAVGLAINLPSSLLLPAGQAVLALHPHLGRGPVLSATDSVTLVLSVQSGTLNVSTSVSSGVTQVTNNGTASVTLTGTRYRKSMPPWPLAMERPIRPRAVSMAPIPCRPRPPIRSKVRIRGALR